MSAHTTDYLEVIEQLPDDAMLRLEDISWDEYEQLLDQTYEECDASLSFPFLSAQAMTGFLDQSKTYGQTAALASFRQWTRAALQASPSND